MTGIGQLRDGRSLRDLGTNCLRLLSVVILSGTPGEGLYAGSATSDETAASARCTVTGTVTWTALGGDQQLRDWTPNGDSRLSCCECPD